MKCSSTMGVRAGGEELVKRKAGDRHLCDLAVGSDAGLGVDRARGGSSDFSDKDKLGNEKRYRDYCGLR